MLKIMNEYHNDYKGGKEVLFRSLEVDESGKTTFKDIIKKRKLLLIRYNKIFYLGEKQLSLIHI